MLSKLLCPSQNKTAIFNIYGITEVSSWATCYQVTTEDLTRAPQACDNSFSLVVPLGSPLLGTEVELRGVDQATIVGGGSGFIWTGS